MKTKKILSVLLVISLLFTLMTTNVFAAEDNTYTATKSMPLSTEYKLTPDNFEISVSLNKNKICALDGNSADYTCDIISFTAVYTDIDGITHSADYITASADFFEIFEKRAADIEFVEEYNADKEPAYQLSVTDITLQADISATFVDDGVFGALEYDIAINGFSAPAISMGDLGFGGGSTELLDVPTKLNLTGAFSGFPTIATKPTVLSKPEKVIYTDAEKFDATGLKIELTTTNGASGTFTYNDTNAFLFNFNPTNKENLSINNSEVITFLNGVEILKTPIEVDHQWSDGYVNITTYKYTSTKPGYHAIVCEGCGETHDAQPHVIDDNAWTYNNDQSFVSNGTESNTCLECRSVLVRDTVGTADFNTVFADMHFIKVIFEYINLLLQFISTAIGR